MSETDPVLHEITHNDLEEVMTDFPLLDAPESPLLTRRQTLLRVISKPRVDQKKKFSKLVYTRY